jgi:hypothetical protein
MANEFKHKDPGTALTQAEFIASDGTGHIFDSQAAGDILYASSTTVLARLAKATDGNVLELASGLPAWTASPTIGSTSWANANHAHAASNSGGTLTTLGTVTTGVWQGTAIASGYIAADAITGAKIADDAVDSEHYTDASIDNAHLADDAVDSDELTAGAVDIAHLSATGTASSSTFLRGDNSWVAAGGIASVAHDGSPQLGGDLDCDGSDITGVGHVGFLASQDASAGANDLDDYEEGTFTVTIADETLNGTSEGQAYSAQGGFYTKVGRKVQVQFRVSISDLGTMTTSNQASIMGLPFASANVTNQMGVMSIIDAGSFALPTAGDGIFGHILKNTSHINLKLFTETTGNSSMTVAIMSVGADINGMAWYTV